MGAVPISTSAARLASRLQRITVGLLALGALAFVLALTSGSAAPEGLATVSLVFGVVALTLTKRHTVGARLSRDGEWVDLKRVHPHFLAAVQTTPTKCAGCTNNSTCSLADMAACDPG